MRKFVGGGVPRGTFGSRILGACGASIVWTFSATKPSYAPVFHVVSPPQFVTDFSPTTQEVFYIEVDIREMVDPLAPEIDLLPGNQCPPCASEP
jgi:hypothetical protein